MESGVIALVDGPEYLEEFHDSVPFGNDAPYDESERCLEIRNDSTLGNGKQIFQGRAAIEELTEQNESQIRPDGSITSGKTINKETRYTEFVFVPNEFVAVENSAGSFLFQLLNIRTEHTVTPVNIDLEGYLMEHGNALVWKLGFKERGGNAENGVLHGRDLLEDREVGNILGQTDKNQLGLEHSYNSDIVKVFVTESSYLNIYQPSNYDSKDFSKYIMDEVIRFTIPQ